MLIVLKHGLNYKIDPKTIPIKYLICDIENAIFDLSNVLALGKNHKEHKSFDRNFEESGHKVSKDATQKERVSKI